MKFTVSLGQELFNGKPFHPHEDIYLPVSNGQIPRGELCKHGIKPIFSNVFENKTFETALVRRLDQLGFQLKEHNTNGYTSLRLMGLNDQLFAHVTLEKDVEDLPAARMNGHGPDKSADQEGACRNPPKITSVQTNRLEVYSSILEIIILVVSQCAQLSALVN